MELYGNEKTVLHQQTVFYNTHKTDLMFLDEILKDVHKASSRLSSVSRVISKISGLNVEVLYTPNKTIEFFGMQIYPKEDIMYDIADRIASNDRYRVQELMELLNQTSWVVEIDSKLLLDKNLNATGPELTAALLHEIGHAKDKNSIANRLYRTYVIKKAEMNQRFKNVARHKDSIFANLFRMPVMKAITAKTYNTDILNSELAADRYVVECGYGYHLQSLIAKMIKTYGSGEVNKSQGELDKEVNMIYQWIINNLNTANVRQRNLVMAITGELIRTPTLGMRNILKTIIPIDLDYDDASQPEARYRLHQHEKSINTIAKNYTTEGLFNLFDTNRKIKEVKQADIDYIALELDKVKTHEDKMYVLDLVYNELDKIEASEDLLASGNTHLVKMSSTKIKDYRKQLEDIRKKILSIKIEDNKYNVFIKYPKGYEG